MQNNISSLETERIPPLFVRLVMPTVAAQVVNLAYNMVDRIYIGRIPGIGGTALTGVGVCMPVILILSALAQLAGGGAPRASFYLGRHDEESAEHTLGACAAFLIAASLVLTVTARVFSKDILLIFGASEGTIKYGLDYLNIYILGTIFVEISMGLASFITAQGFTRISMASVLIGAGTNILLDPVFIYTFDMGVRGAAIATILSQAFSVVWVLVFLTGRKTVLRLRRKYLHFHTRLLLPALALGLSPFVMTATESAVLICFNRALLQFGGDIAVGTMTIFSTIMSAATYPLMGIGQGIQPIVSYNHGAGQWERVKKSCCLTFASCLGFSGVIWTLILLFPTAFVQIFAANDQSLCLYAAGKMRIFFSMLWVMGAQYAGQNLFLALGNARTSLFIALLRKVFLLIPLIWILPTVLPYPVQAVFLAEPISDTVTTLTTVCLFFHQYKSIFKQNEKEAVTMSI